MIRPDSVRLISVAGLIATAVLLTHCGGGGHHQNIVTAGSNVQSITVNSGPTGKYANGLFTSVTVCVPSTSNCQTISGVLVDTGSYGLRLLSSAGSGALTLSLPQQPGPIGECASFVDGYIWGPVATADIKISGETASNVPLQIIDPTFKTVPARCASAGIPENDQLQVLGANGILGIGPFLEDCGDACTQTGSGNPGVYYECSSTPCQVAAEPVAQQVANPVGAFATDNNGVVIELPALTVAAPSLTGSMVFGIGTQSNNAISGVGVFPINSNGQINTSFKGKSYPAFVDSGSNGLFFLDSGTTSLPACSDNSSFYCPSPAANLSASNVSGTATQTLNFTVNNADTLFSNRSAFAFPGLAGPNSGLFDWGLPFFFGRNVFTAIDSRNTPAGFGPYWAY